MIARILTLAVVLFLLARLALGYRQGKASLRRTLLWTAPWVGLGVVMLSPGLADRVAALLGLQTATGIDLVAYVAVGVGFYMLFRVFLRLDALERQITALTRRLAIQDAGEDEPRS